MTGGARIVRSSNHHSLFEHGFIESGVLLEEHRNPTVSGDEEQELEDGSGVTALACNCRSGISVFAEIFVNRADINLLTKPDDSASAKHCSQLLREASISDQDQRERPSIKYSVWVKRLHGDTSSVISKKRAQQ